MHDRVADRGVVPLMAAKATSRPEGRPRLMGNPGEQVQDRTQRRTLLPPNLTRANDAAKGSRQTRFTALLHHLDVAALETAYRRLRRHAAPRVDAVPRDSYWPDLAA